MVNPRKILVSWSSGKDSAWTLHVLRQDPQVEVVGLLTTVNTEFDRVAMHAVRTELLRAQAQAVGLPLFEVPIPYPCSNEVYAQSMQTALDSAVARGVEGVAFGDLFLEEVRLYREERMRATGLLTLFPLWGSPTAALVRDMLAAGVRTRLTCVDPRQLSPSFAGRDLDRALLEEFPPSVDPCGENGEFHTFAYDGPMFTHPVPICCGEVVERDGFVFADVLLDDSTSPEASGSPGEGQSSRAFGR